MGQRQCDRCGDTFDEAKAFCPGCGKAFVEEEKRQNISEFDQQGNTVQLGNTMYNQMLSDMGLNISKASDVPEKRVEIIAPVGESTGSHKPQPEPEPIGHVVDVASRPRPVAVPDEPRSKKSGRAKWIVLGVIGFILLFPPALASTILLVYEIWMRLR
jgi:hypothetical protein